MKCPSGITICLMLILTSTAWGQRSSYDPAAKQQSKLQEGFVDFALKQINPQNTDYGCQMDEARKLVVDQTIKSIDSWAVSVALIFLVLSFVMLLHQHRERNRREVIAADFLAQYHNAWVDARKQAEDSIRRYNELVNTTNNGAEAALRSPSLGAGHVQAGAVKPDLGRAVRPPSAPAVAAKNTTKAGENGADRSDSGPSIKPPVRQNREPEVDLIAQIGTLQQQLNASHEREKNLQKELSKAQRRAPAVQPTDASLPG
jgi:hypothetical protein